MFFFFFFVLHFFFKDKKTMSHSLTLPLVLGSSSVGRQSVLKQTGLPFSIIVADIDEKAVNGGFK